MVRALLIIAVLGVAACAPPPPGPPPPMGPFASPMYAPAPPYQAFPQEPKRDYPGPKQ